MESLRQWKRLDEKDFLLYGRTIPINIEEHQTARLGDSSINMSLSIENDETQPASYPNSQRQSVDRYDHPSVSFLEEHRTKELIFDGKTMVEASSTIEIAGVPSFSSDLSMSEATIQDLRKRKLQDESHLSVDSSDLDEEALVTKLQKYLSEDLDHL